MSAKPVVRATEIGEYIRHHSCERRFKLDHNDRQLTRSLPFFFSLFHTMDPALAEAGKLREKEWEASVSAAGLRDLCRYEARPRESSTAWEIFVQRAREIAEGECAYGREIDIAGDLGAFHITGRVDFVLLLWENGQPKLRLVECKASRKDRTYHRIQLVLYRLLVRQLLTACLLTVAGKTVDPAAVEGIVARIDETTGALHDIVSFPALDLAMEEADVLRLLASEGPLTHILHTDLEELPYQLDEKCDDCVLNLHCLPESARQRRLELLGIDPPTVRALQQAGIHTLDDLAAIDVRGPQAAAVRADPGFSANMETLRQKALARRSTLPGGDTLPEEHEVIGLKNAGDGQLPAHQLGDRQLLRVFVTVCFDYVENRIGAIAAHITRSDKPLSTLFQEQKGTLRPIPEVVEQWKVGENEAGRPLWQQRELQGEDIVGVLPEPWTGDYAKDTAREADLLQRFFNRIVRVIQKLCPDRTAPIHFYLWSRSEMARLVEACSRADTDLLGHLRQLLGCRESLEQLIYSCLQDEVDNRYVLGWTGRSLSVATGLKWYGRRFHWTRQVKEDIVALDRLFANDLFDYRTRLRVAPDGTWRPPEDRNAERHLFEVRASFQSNLSAPYWRAYWNILPEPDIPGRDPRFLAAIRRYRAAGKYLKAFLKARGQALRWIEEGVSFKNNAITKPQLEIAALPTFTLGVDDAAHAALDFLYLEQHVKVNDWIAAHLVPPAQRVPSGKTLPLKEVHAVSRNLLIGTIDLSGYPLSRADLAIRSGFTEKGFARLCPCGEDPQRGQTIGQLLRGGSTCVIDRLDWATGQVELKVIAAKEADRFVLPSRAWSEEDIPYSRATLEESPTDYVGGKVEDRLHSAFGRYVYQWFDPQRADILAQSPLTDADREKYARFLEQLDLGRGPLAADQRQAVLDGLSSRIQLLQGPPGTGKTQTTTIAALLRILHRARTGEVVLLAANTHTAVNTLLERLASLAPPFMKGARQAGLDCPPVLLSKVISGEGQEELAPEISVFPQGSAIGFVAAQRAQGVLVIGGTPGTLLKMAKSLGESPLYCREAHRFQVPILIVDEASMLVQPYFLALASLVREAGEILLAGDHRQLAPIVAHDWDREDRPPAVLYQPYVSAYEAVRNLKQNQQLPDAAIRQSALSFTFRLPPAIRDLIARLYRRDAIELDGHPAPVSAAGSPPAGGWNTVWQEPTGLYLVVHSERQSKQSNRVEAQILREILAAGGNLAAGSVGVVMPHRAQRSLLTEYLAAFQEAVDVLDTVERLQGGERDTIIVSATSSDPTAISAHEEFILNLNRANVAFSRAKKRLIVVCAETLLDHIPPEIEHYQAALLWKSLRSLCTRALASAEVNAHRVEIRTLP